MSPFRERLAWFFRGTWEDYVFPSFTPVHFLLLGIALAGILLIIAFRRPLRADQRALLKKALLGGLLLEQVSQYGWYWLAGTFTLGDGLPLYICRTAILALILALVTDWPRIRSLAVYWGTFGGTLALLMPVIYPMRFPHITNFTYFGGHSIMVWTVTWLMVVRRHQLDQAGLRFSLAFTNAFNLAVFFLNPRLGGNYSYFEFPPVFRELLAPMPRPVYVGLVFLLYNLLILFIHWLFTRGKSSPHPPTEGNPAHDKLHLDPLPQPKP